MMESFKKQYERMEEAYGKANPFRALIERKTSLAQAPLILYGCGILCGTVVSVCRDHGIKITAICDTYKTGTDQDSGLGIISPEHLKEAYPDANVIICSYRYGVEIKKTLHDLGFSDLQIHQPTSTINSFLYPSDFARNHLEGYEWAYNFFEDDSSKKLVMDRIWMYYTGTEILKTTTGKRYFEPEIIRLDSNEVFVDGGAYVGDTAEEFIRQTKEQSNKGYRHLYSFEPDPEAYHKAVFNLKKYPDIDVIAKGLWSSETELSFFSDVSNASSSIMVGTGIVSVPVTSLDSFFSDKAYDELPTFIKLDIEGSEKEALVGAKNVIGLKHPKLAICVYHKPEDIYELTRLIYEIDPGYKFTLHQCTDGIYDTVLYAV
jgi:FkbM family methyltransferase